MLDSENKPATEIDKHIFIEAFKKSQVAVLSPVQTAEYLEGEKKKHFD
jgi:hypothetical protein